LQITIDLMSRNPETEITPNLTAGQMLRQARLKAGVDLAVLSVQLKVPVKQLEDLEADMLDPRKGPVFYRGLTASVCRHLGTDAAPILQLLPRLSGQLEPIKQLQLPSGPAHFNRDPAFRPNFPSRFIWLGAILLGLALFFIGMPSTVTWTEQLLSKWSFWESPTEEQVIQDIGLQPAVSAQPVLAPGTELNPPANASSATATNLTSVSSPLLHSPQDSATSSNTRVQESVSPNLAPWQFTASAESWLELRDAKNAVVWSGVLKAGVTQRIESPLPVRVVVGRASVVSVTLRGQAFDLKPHTRSNAARFEVKE
jgi:cytoskeleton protein RodZ